VDVLINVVYV